ncbi:MAG: C39 family peptidase [bacterium]|nr:C39 family peptidase [bacterium]MDZ4248321.1 C39 family peptidase [Patescibacteria group bacterium]
MSGNKKKFPLRLLLLSCVLAAAFVVPNLAEADPIDEFTKIEQRLSEKAGEIDTLQGELDLLNETAEAKLAVVAELQGRVAEVRGELDAITAHLEELAGDELSSRESLQQVVRVDYIEGSPGAWEVLAGAGGLSEALGQQNAQGSLGDYANGLAEDLEKAQKDIDRDRKSLVSRKQNLERLESEAGRQLRELEAVRNAKRQLLESTQGQEDAYQKQYAALRDQLIKMGIFGRSGCSRVGSHVWPGTDGYFNQCDSRWADWKLGYSDSSTLGDYGCGVAALAMVYKTYGGVSDTNPLRMNQELRRAAAFWDDLLVWGNVSGAYDNALRVTAHGGADWDLIKRRLDAGSPVMVYIDRGVTNHYVVLLRRDGSEDYLMHDPIEGPNRRFSDYYSTGAVQQYVTFRRT